MKETTSSAKIAKKARQIYRKDFRNEMHEHAEYFKKVLKPRPRWIPQSIYVRILGLFLKIQK